MITTAKSETDLCPFVPLSLCFSDPEWDDGVTNWTETEARTFVYDGWSPISEICNVQSEITTNMFIWGIDLSGSLTGAGGVGGLLSVVRDTNAYFTAFDANGNVSEYLNADGEIVGHREYSPFGESVVATGDKQSDFAHWFSTKYKDDETGLLYYGYRYYSPSLGRWLSRDPIGEWGGLNLYVIVYNNIINNLDGFGLHLMGILPSYAGQVEICTVSSEKDKKNCEDKPCKKCSTIWLPTGDKIKDALDKLAAEGKQVNSITLKGHGDPELMTIGWQKSGDILTVDVSGNIKIETSSGMQDIKDVLASVLTPDAIIILNGCRTARGQDSLAERLSETLGTTTQGKSTVALNIPFTSTSIAPTISFPQGPGHSDLPPCSGN